MRMKKTGTAVLTGKAKIMTVVFALTVFIIGIVCYTAAFAANGNGSFYAFIPEKGVVSKDGGTKNFYYAEECDSFNSKDFECGGFFAYLDENKRQLEIIYEADYCGKDPDGFFKEYGVNGKSAEDKVTVESMSGKKLSAVIANTVTHDSTRKGENCDRLVFSGVFSLEGDDKTFKAVTDKTELTFTLKPHGGVSDIKELGDVYECKNGVRLLKTKGEFHGKEGFYLSLFLNGEGLKSVSGPYSAEFFNEKGESLNEKTTPHSNVCTSSLFFRGSNTAFYELNGASFDEISSVRFTARGDFNTEEKFIKLKEGENGKYVLFSDYFVEVKNVKKTESSNGERVTFFLEYDPRLYENSPAFGTSQSVLCGKKSYSAYKAENSDYIGVNREYICEIYKNTNREMYLSIGLSNFDFSEETVF